ncbi:MAG: hypothetical protein ACF8R7_17305 [Phycisphaerales bacterium JB039]
MRLAIALLVSFACCAAAQQAPVEIIGPDGRPAIAIDRPQPPATTDTGMPLLWILASATALLGAAGASAWTWRIWARLPVEERAFCLLALRLGLGRRWRRQIERIAAHGKTSPIAVALSPGALGRLGPGAGIAPEDLAALQRRLPGSVPRGA